MTDCKYVIKDYKYYLDIAYTGLAYPQFGVNLTLKSNKIDFSTTNREFLKHLNARLFNPVKFIVYNFCIPLSYDVDTQMFEIDGSLLLYKDSHKYYNELPNYGILFTTTYLSLETINQAMDGKFPKGTDLQTHLNRGLTKK